MDNRLIDSYFSPSRIHTKSKGKKLMEMEWREIQLFILFLCILSKFSYKHISLIYIIFFNAIFIWDIQIFSWGWYPRKTKAQLAKVIKGVYLSKTMLIFWSSQSLVVIRILHITLSVSLHPTSFDVCHRHSWIQFWPSPSAVPVGGCSETCKEPMGKLLIARSRQ